MSAIVAIGLLVGVGGGCTKSKPADAPPTAPAPPSFAPADVPHGPGAGQGGPGGGGAGAGGGGSGGGGGGGGGQGGGVGGRIQAPIVTLDGVPLASMRFGELPPGLKTDWTKIDGVDKPVRRFVLIDYVKALGVDVTKLKAMHLYSGRGRVAVLDPKLLIAKPDTALFSFTQSNAGKVQMRWPAETPTTDRIDKLTALALYENKPAPVMVNGQPTLDGKAIDDPPYLTTDTQGGTRVYLDGRLQTFIRPRDLDQQQHSLLSVLHFDTSRVKSADLIWQEKPLKHLDRAELEKTEIVDVGGNGGMLQLVPGGDTVAAVLLYAGATPPVWGDR